MYLDSLELINFFLSTNLNASLPQIGWYRIGLGTLVGNFVEPFELTFHNLIRGPSIGLHTRSVGETLYCIIGQPEELTKNLNRCISVCLTNISKPSFKQPRTQDLKFGISWINWGVNHLSYEIMKAFIKFAKSNCFLPSTFLTNSQNIHLYPHVYGQLK